MITSRILGILFLSTATCLAASYSPQEGDLVFQTSRSSQSQAIQLVTKSRYSHVGMVSMKGGKPHVFEACGSVRITPLSDWIRRGEGGHFVAKRLTDAGNLSPDQLAALRRAAEGFSGRPYDVMFEWSDRKIYCSELVWKVYDRALGLQLGRLQSFGSLDLGSAEARSVAQQRWGGMPPASQKLITPAAIYASSRLQTVHTQW